LLLNRALQIDITFFTLLTYLLVTSSLLDEAYSFVLFMASISAGAVDCLAELSDHMVSDITGGPCKEFSYVLEQFHLHWGEEDAAGSEHLINSTAYPAEVCRAALLVYMLLRCQR